MQNIKLQEGGLAEQISKLPETTIQQILSQSNNWNSYTEQMRMMDGIAAEMKEIPVLPSEVPKDTNPLLSVEFPKEGGVLTHMQNFEYPYRGFPHHQFVESLDFIKKTSRSFISGLYYELKSKNKLWFLTLIPGLWFSKSAVRSAIHVYFKLLERIKIKQIRYCQFCRELYRVFSLPGGNTELKEHLKVALCMLLEMDNAYRYRAQDILAELDKKNLKKRPIKELLRLLNLLQSREDEQQVKDTWKLVKYLVKYYLVFDRELQKTVVNALLELDLEKVRLTKEDKIFCAPREDYTFGFELNPTEEDRVLIEKSKKKKESDEKKSKIIIESTKAHQELTERYKNDLQNEDYLKQMRQLDEKYESLLKAI